MELMIPLETPSKKNSRINTRSGRSFPNRRYCDWHQQASLHVYRQAGEKRITRPCIVSMVFTHGDRRRRDSDNGVSSILDLLVDCGILPDDNWQMVRVIQVYNRFREKEPSCMIKITEDEDGEEEGKTA